MNEAEIIRIFKARYTHAVIWVNRFRMVYAILCLILIVMGIYYYAISNLLFVLILFLSIPAICYPFIHLKLFNRWSEKTLRNILTEANETTTGTILEIQSGFGIHQVNYSYVVDGKKIKAYDLVNKQQALNHYKGLEVPVRYMQSKPKLGYIEI